MSISLARCLKAISHEIVHCLQSKIKQTDPEPMSWSAEHDASYLAGSLLYSAIASSRERADKKNKREKWR